MFFKRKRKEIKDSPKRILEVQWADIIPAREMQCIMNHAKVGEQQVQD